jgi:hypothetical protein
VHCLWPLLTFQTEFFIENYRTDEEDEALKTKVELLRKRLLVFKEKVDAAFAVQKELRALVEIQK